MKKVGRHGFSDEWWFLRPRAFAAFCAAVREYVVGAAAIARRAYTAQAVGTDAAR